MGSVPAYRRIYEDLAAQIRSGELEPASRLLGEATLASQYGVARMTVRQALAKLVDDSLVVRQQGVGTFVAGDTAGRRSLNRLTSFSEDMLGSGQQLSTEILAQLAVAPSAEVAQQLKIGNEGRVIYLARVRKFAGTPKSLHHSYLPFGEFPSLVRESLRGGSLYRTLEEVFDVRLRRADQWIKATGADVEVARHLNVPVGSPVLQTQRLTTDDRNVRIEFARSWARPELELAVHLER